MFLGIVCLDGGRLNLARAEHLTETDFTRWTRRVTPRPGDVVFSYETRIGEAARIPPGFRGCLGRRMGLLRPKPNVDPSFLLYAYLGPEFQETLRSRTIHGSTVDRIPLVQLGDFPIRVPPLAEQQVIGSVLAALDDKIDLNRRMSQTLESMARALFKSWFVDFDPARAKAECRDPHLPEQLSEQLPDSLSDSEIGEIPEGWQVRHFGAVVEQLRDQENPLSSPDTRFHHYSIPAFDDGQNAVAEYGESIKSLKSRVPPGTVLLSKLNPKIERVWLVDVQSHERAVCSTEFLVLAPLSPFRQSFVYCLARSPQFRGQIDALVTGTSNSHQRAQAGSILGLPVVVPPPRMVEAFDAVASSLLSSSLECRRESLTLAELREILLPDLISGQAHIPDSVAARREA